MGPNPGGLLELQAGAPTAGVTVRHGVAAERAVFGPELSASGVSKLGGPGGVHQVGHAVERVELIGALSKPRTAHANG